MVSGDPSFIVVRAARRTPIQERALLANAVGALIPLATDDEGGFHAPSIHEFFPDAFLLNGTPFEVNRIILIRLIAVAAVILLVWLGVRRMSVVPGRWQGAIEFALGFVRTNISEDLLGKKDGQRFLPILTTIFFMALAMNLTGIIPFLNIAGSATIGAPLVLAIVAYATFIYAGIKKSPAKFFRNSLFPAGVPWPIYIIVTPIEIISTFVIRPVTLTLRLLMNMMVGHLLLVLFFSATQFFFFTAQEWYIKPLGLGSLAFGFVFTLFELLVAALQAYVFALLTAVYIQLAVAEEH